MTGNAVSKFTVYQTCGHRLTCTVSHYPVIFVVGGNGGCLYLGALERSRKSWRTWTNICTPSYSVISTSSPLTVHHHLPLATTTAQIGLTTTSRIGVEMGDNGSETDDGQRHERRPGVRRRTNHAERAPGAGRSLYSASDLRSLSDLQSLPSLCCCCRRRWLQVLEGGCL